MRKNKILLVEDDIILAKDIQKILHNLGYSVTSIVSTPKNALPKVKEDKPDLVLMDIVQQDGLDGIKIARKIHDRFDIPIVYISAHSDKEFVDRAKITEPFGYLLKPVDERNLFITIEISLYKHAIEKKLKKRTAQALLERENLYQLLVENINEGIVMQNNNGIINYANEKFMKMIGYTHDEVLGHPITNFLGEGLLKKDSKQEVDLKKAMSRICELSLKKKDGERIFTILSLKPIYDEQGHFKGSVAVLTDITERRQVERALHRSREELRNLSHHLQSLREKESKRIAREIHDELGQKLTALKMDLSWLSRKVPSNKVEQENFFRKTKAMAKLIDETIQTVQKLSAELRPGLLDDLGLIPAIEWLAQEFQIRTNIQCRTQINCAEIELEPEVSTAIFRISQEALTNVARHSKATRVNISLKEKTGLLELQIHDNGEGIKKADIHAPSSLGLMGMRERIRPFGGELNINGMPEKGTTLKITLPIKRL